MVKDHGTKRRQHKIELEELEDPVMLVDVGL